MYDKKSRTKQLPTTYERPTGQGLSLSRTSAHKRPFSGMQWLKQKQDIFMYTDGNCVSETVAR